MTLLGALARYDYWQFAGITLLTCGPLGQSGGCLVLFYIYYKNFT